MGSPGVILLDTCALIWDALQPSRLTDRAREAITRGDQQNALFMSDISHWEVAMLVKRRRLDIAASSSEFLNLYLRSRDVSVIPISPEIAELSCSFDTNLGKDPADRIICATALLHNASIVTADRNMLGNKLLDTTW